MNFPKDKIKKILYPLSFILFIILIFLLSSKTKTLKNASNITTPIIPENTQSLQKNLNTNIINNIKPASNLTPTDLGEAKIESGKIILGSKKVALDENINNFNAYKNFLIIETGDIYGENKTYYWYDTQNNTSQKINTNKIKQVVSYTLDPTNKSIYFLGNYSPNTDQSNLYKYDIEKKNFTLLASNIKSNTLKQINTNFLALISIKHMPLNNTEIKLFDLNQNKILENSILTGDNLHCHSFDQIISYDQSKKVFVKTNLSDLSQENLKNELVSDESHLYCTSKNYYLIENSESKKTTKILDLNFNLVSTQESKNTKQKTYIQSYVQNDKIVNKYLNKDNEVFYLSQD